MRIFVAALVASALAVSATASAGFVTVKNKDADAHSIRIKNGPGNNDQKISAKSTRDYTCNDSCTLILRNSGAEIKAAADQTVVIKDGQLSTE